MAERKKLGEILLQAKVITPEQLKDALADQKKYGGRLGAILLDRRHIDEKAFLYALSQQLKIPAIDFSKSSISENVIHIVSQEVQEKNMVFPVAVKRTPSGNVLILAMSDPTNVEIQDHIRFSTGYRVEPVLALESVIRQSVRDYWYTQDGKGSYRYKPDLELGSMQSVEGDTSQTEWTRGNRMIDFDAQGQAVRENQPSKVEKAAKEGQAEFNDDLAKAKPTRELLALLRLLARKGLITEKEFMEELKKTK